jgi:hypothetical protein
MFPQLVIILLSTAEVSARSGILMNGGEVGRTQLYIPGNPPISTHNVNFRLPILKCQTVVMLNGNAYFTDGFNSTEINTTVNCIFSMITARGYTIRGNMQHLVMIFVCDLNF